MLTSYDTAIISKPAPSAVKTENNDFSSSRVVLQSQAPIHVAPAEERQIAVAPTAAPQIVQSATPNMHLVAKSFKALYVTEV